MHSHDRASTGAIPFSYAEEHARDRAAAADATLANMLFGDGPLPSFASFTEQTAPELYVVKIERERIRQRHAADLATLLAERVPARATLAEAAERASSITTPVPAKKAAKPTEPRHKDEFSKRCPTWFRQNATVQRFISCVEAGAKATGKPFAIGYDCSLSDIVEALERLDVFKDKPTIQPRTKREMVSGWCKRKGVQWQEREHAHSDARVETLLEMHDAGVDLEG